MSITFTPATTNAHNMKTSYSIIPAPQGTSDKEIAKAKRLYRKGVKAGSLYGYHEIEIIFYDVNGIVSCDYVVHGIGSVASFKL